MGILSDKLNEKINTSQVAKYGETIGRITSYDHTTNTASIIFMNPNGGGTLIADNVAFQLGYGGGSASSPAEGQKCCINFLNNNLLTPVISSLFDDQYYENVYSKKTNADAGAYLVDEFIHNTDTKIKTTPMIQDWLDINNNDDEKYVAFHDNYKEKKIVAEVYHDIAQLDKYLDTEDGITNIKNKSTIKCKDNGDIDIFVSNNTGIRINPDNKTISFFGLSLNTFMEKWTINNDVTINGNLTVNGQIQNEVK